MSGNVGRDTQDGGQSLAAGAELAAERERTKTRPAQSLLSPLFSARVLPWLVALAAALVLASVHVLQAFGWAPCELCLRQRVPYWIAGALALLAGIAAMPRFKLGPASMLLMACAALTFLIGAGLAVQHIGVEEHWWKSTCSAGGGTDIGAMLKAGPTPLVQCDEKRPFLFGLTLPVYNLFVSILLAAAAASLPLRALKRRA